MVDLKKLKEASAKDRAAIDKVQQAIAKLLESKADHTEEYATISMLHDAFGYLSSQVYRIEDTLYGYMYEHGKGHLPQINSASNMEKLLDAAGMGEDFEVQKPILSVASDRKGGSVIEVSFSR